MNVVIFGAGYVGLVTGAVLADLGNRVTLIDVDADKVGRINQGRSPIFEFAMEKLLRRVRKTRILHATTDPSTAVNRAHVIFIAVGTPPRDDGAPNLDYVHQAATMIGQHLNPGQNCVIVNKATVPIGSANLVEMWINDGYRQQMNQQALEKTFTVASNPEFLREGHAIHDTLYPDRIVLGADNEWALERLIDLYQPILDQSFDPPEEVPRPPGLTTVPLVSTDCLTAETQVSIHSDGFGGMFEEE